MPSQTYAATINATGTAFVFVPPLPTGGAVNAGDKFTFVLGAGWGSAKSVDMTIVLYTDTSKKSSPFSPPDDPIRVTSSPSSPPYTVNNSAKGITYQLQVQGLMSPKLTTLTGTLKVNN